MGVTYLAIETSNLRKEYGSNVAVQDLTLQVTQGEVFGFLGPNGAGKSTTINMMLDLVRPTSGELRLLGLPPSYPGTRSRVGFLPEHFRFHEWLRAGEFLAFHGNLYGLRRDVLAQRIPRLLDLVGLSSSTDKRLAHFSKGMLQRIGLAQAMLNNPDIVFLDEPTSGLDPLGRRLVRDIIRQLKDNGTTVFLNSHLLSEVEATCDRVAFIKEGRIVQMDDVSNLLNLTTEVYLRVDAIKPELLSDLERFGKSLEVNHGAISLMVDKMEVVPSIAQLVVQHGARLYELKPRQRSLEEVFLKAVGSTEQDSQ